MMGEMIFGGDPSKKFSASISVKHSCILIQVLSFFHTYSIGMPAKCSIIVFISNTDIMTLSSNLLFQCDD